MGSYRIYESRSIVQSRILQLKKGRLMADSMRGHEFSSLFMFLFRGLPKPYCRQIPECERRHLVQTYPIWPDEGPSAGSWLLP